MLLAPWHGPLPPFTGKYNAALEALKEQELDDARIAELQEEKKFVDNKAVVIKPQAGLPEKARIEPKDVLPGYMVKLVCCYQRSNSHLGNATPNAKIPSLIALFTDGRV